MMGHVRAERQHLLEEASGKLARLIANSGANVRKLEAGARALGLVHPYPRAVLQIFIIHTHVTLNSEPQN